MPRLISIMLSLALLVMYEQAFTVRAKLGYPLIGETEAMPQWMTRELAWDAGWMVVAATCAGLLVIGFRNPRHN